MGIRAKRRSKPLGAQARLEVYPHLRGLGVVRPVRGPAARAGMRPFPRAAEEDGSIGLAWMTVLVQAAWLSGAFFRIPVLADLGLIPAVAAPAAVVVFSRSWGSRARAVVVMALAIPVAVMLVAALGLGLGAGIAWARESSLAWLARNWGAVLDQQLSPFFDVWWILFSKTILALIPAALARALADRARR